MMPIAAALPTGALLPESLLRTDSLHVLATFVALNTLMYATLALLKVIPKGYAFTWFGGRNRRTQDRGIGSPPPDADRDAASTVPR